MNLRSFAPRALAAVAGLALCSLGHASTFSASGTFLADNSFSELTFTVNGASNFSAATTSYASGGFIPVFTLFNDTTGIVIDNNGSAVSDAMLSDVLSAGTYDLFLTEFPNVAIDNLSDGFLYANVPDATGQNYNGGTGMFLDGITGQQRTANYAYTASTTAVTPEPSSLLLMLPGAAAVMYSVRRRFV